MGVGDWVALALLGGGVVYAATRPTPRPRVRPPPPARRRRYSSSTDSIRRRYLRGAYPGWWDDMLRRYDYRCAYCGRRGDHRRRRLHKEHDIPLSRGGPHDVANIVPACVHCNLVKGTLTGDEFRALIAANGGTVPASRKKKAPKVRPPGLQDVITQAVQQLASTTDADDWTVTEIVDAVRAAGCDAPLGSLRATISTMGTKGLLERTARGRYRLP